MLRPALIDMEPGRLQHDSSLGAQHAHVSRPEDGSSPPREAAAGAPCARAMQRRQRPANEPAPAEQLQEEADEAAIVKMPKATGTAQMVSSR